MRGLISIKDRRTDNFTRWYLTGKSDHTDHLPRKDANCGCKSGTLTSSADIVDRKPSESKEQSSEKQSSEK